MSEQQKDTLKKEVKDVQKKEKGFVKLQDLTKEMFESLPVMMVKLECKITRKKYKVHSISFGLHEQLLNNITIQIKEPEYNLMRMRLRLPLLDKLNKERNSYNLECRYRFVKGMNTNGEYKSIELIFDKGVYKIYYFNDYYENEVLTGLDQSKEIKIDWYDRPDKLDSTETINSSWD